MLLRIALNKNIYQNMWKLSFWGANKNVNSSTEFQYWISKRANNSWLNVPHCNLFSLQWQQASLWNEKLALQQSLYWNQSFSRLGTHFEERPKILIYRQISSNIFFAYKLSYENNSQSSGQSSRSSHPQYKWG